jgi:ribosomal protein S14
MTPETAEKLIHFWANHDIDARSHSTGMVEQFQRDLLVTGRAVMPDGEIVDLFPQPPEAFPETPLPIKQEPTADDYLQRSVRDAKTYMASLMSCKKCGQTATIEEQGLCRRCLKEERGF